MRRGSWRCAAAAGSSRFCSDRGRPQRAFPDRPFRWKGRQRDRTVYDNVAYAMYIVRATPKHIRRQVPMILSLVGLSNKAKMYPNELSGGEQQRVALARALVNNPSMLIADEPTGNLDPETAWDIMALLEDINKRGTTVVVATHARDIVDKMKKRVIQIEEGNIIRDDKRGGYSSEI